MSSRPRRVRLARGAVAALLAVSPHKSPNATAQTATPSVRQAMLIAEDGRVATEAALAPVMKGLTHRDATVVIAAIRALGRFERGSLVGRVAPLLTDGRPTVRAEAAHALGQLGRDTTTTSMVRRAVLEAIAAERDPTVLGALARSLARLPGVMPVEAVRALKEVLPRNEPASLVLDLARAMETVARSPSASQFSDQPTLEVLHGWTKPASRPAEVAVAIRRAATMALTRLDRGSEVGIQAAMADPDPVVRLAGVQWIADTVPVPYRRRLLGAALADKDPMVRLGALRAWGHHFQAEDCGLIMRALDDPAPHVGLAAIDLLGRPCPNPANAADALYPIVDSLAGSQRGAVSALARWHRGARAMVSLARIAPNRIRSVLSRAASNETWQVRMYAARAAGILGDADRLRDFLADRDDNVRQAAIEGMLRVRGHGADSIFIAQLRRPDYHLVMTAAQALAGTPDKHVAATALLAALDRISLERKDTSRDPRVAILERLAEVGTAVLAPRLERYLTDFDPEVANRAAGLIERWTGRRPDVNPRRLAGPPLSWAEAQRLKGSRLRFTMAGASGGGTFEVALYPDLAPATVLRVVGRARARRYDGLTFHRVEPNFVIQGLSPGANEFAGDSLYMRDEISSLSHERGTLGISTRGRDTGDAQIFVNLVENLRLDFDYTVWGRVVRGMEVVDGMLEGDVVDRVELVGGR